MAKKRKAPTVIKGLDITIMQLQYRHDGWKTGYGFHESKKYSRKKKHRYRLDE